MSKNLSEHIHEHINADGTITVHSHEHEHTHAHTHTQTKNVLQRINNIIGHLQGISEMIQTGRDCSDVLIQLSAVNAAVRKLKIIILKDHIDHCVVDAIKEGDSKTLDKLAKALEHIPE